VRILSGVREYALALLLFLPLIFLAAFELQVMIAMGPYLGAFGIITLCLLTGALGLQIARLQGLSTLMRMQDLAARRILPAAEMLDAAIILVAGVLLVVPGFITDITGALLLIPAFRKVLRSRVFSWAKNNARFTSAQSQTIVTEEVDVKVCHPNELRDESRKSKNVIIDMN